MDLGIEGKKAAVAASSAGLGLGAAKALAIEGVQVAISGRDPAKLAAARDEIEAHSGRSDTVVIEADVSDPAGGHAFVDAAVAELGRSTSW